MCNFVSVFLFGIVCVFVVVRDSFCLNACHCVYMCVYAALFAYVCEKVCFLLCMCISV